MGPSVRNKASGQSSADTCSLSTEATPGIPRCQAKRMGFLPQVEIPPLPLTVWVTSGNSPRLSEPQYPHPCNGDKNSTCSVELLNKALITALSLYHNYCTYPGPDLEAAGNKFPQIVLITAAVAVLAGHTPFAPLALGCTSHLITALYLRCSQPILQKRQ